MCFSPDGRQVISGSFDNTVKLWDVSSGTCNHSFNVQTNGFKCLLISPDGKMLLTGSIENALKLWDIERYECIHILKVQSHIKSVCFSPNSRMVLTLCNDGTVNIWAVESGKCIYTFHITPTFITKINYNAVGSDLTPGSSNSIVETICFNADGRKIIATSKNETHILDLDFDLEFPGWHDWRDGAQPYLDIFLTLHPRWTDKDFNNILIPDLQNRGYGWLRPDGVRVKLEEMTAQMQKPTRTF